MRICQSVVGCWVRALFLLLTQRARCYPTSNGTTHAVQKQTMKSVVWEWILLLLLGVSVFVDLTACYESESVFADEPFNKLHVRAKKCLRSFNHSSIWICLAGVSKAMFALTDCAVLSFHSDTSKCLKPFSFWLSRQMQPINWINLRFFFSLAISV